MVIIGLLVAVAVPAFGPMITKRRLESVTTRIWSDIELARMWAVRSNRAVNFSMSTGTSWCFGYMDDGSACDCAGSCDHEFQSGASGVPGLTLTTASTDSSGGQQVIPFDTMGIRNVAAAGTPTITLSLDGQTAKIAVNPIGNTRICSDDLAGYQADGACP